MESNEGVMAATADVFCLKTERETPIRAVHEVRACRRGVFDTDWTAERRDELSDIVDSDDDESKNLPLSGVSERDGSEGDTDFEGG